MAGQHAGNGPYGGNQYGGNQYGGYQPQPQPPQKRRRRGRGCLGIVAGVVVLIVVVIIITAIAGGSHNSSSSPTPAATSAATSAAAPSPATAAKAATVGTAVRDGKFQFTVTSVSTAKSVGDVADGIGDTAQGEYTILHVTVKNIGNQAQTLDDSAQYVYDTSGRKYDAATAADIDLNSSDGADSVFLNDINPGNTVQGQIAFDMPTDVKAVKAELHDSPFSGGVTVSLP